MSSRVPTPLARRTAASRAKQSVACLVALLAPILLCAQPVGRGAPASEGVSASQLAPREVGLAEVSDRLGVAPEQRILWDAYRARVDAYTSAYYRQKPTLPSADEAAPHQIGQLVDKLQNRLAALEDVEGAAKDLYASLTPAQQKIANEWLVLSIPTFLPSSSAAAGSDTGGQGSKPTGGKGPHRGGGGMPGSMMEN
jgi:hypothetical protein